MVPRPSSTQPPITPAGEACTGNIFVNSNCVGWTWDRGAYSFFTDPEADPAQGGTSPEAINNAGQVAGYFLDASGVPHGFLKNGDSFTTIDPPAASFTLAYGIDDRGASSGFTSIQLALFMDSSGAVTGSLQLSTFPAHPGPPSSASMIGETWPVVTWIKLATCMDSSHSRSSLVAASDFLTVGLCLRTSPRS
jgi:probable HAF family extracellular repeat protein